MTRITLLLALSAAFALGGTAETAAQSKIDARGHIELARYKKTMSARQKALGTSVEPARRVRVLVGFHEGVDPTITELPEGMTLSHAAGRHALVSLPIDALECLAGLESVKSVSWPAKRRLLMNHARASAGIDAAHTGIEHAGVSHKFTGRGVVVGMMDGGLQANHINFLNADGTSRIKRLWNFTGDDYGEISKVDRYTDATISQFTTDTDEETHATHVAGIMAGSYNGTGTYMNLTDPSMGTSTKTTGTIPFHGIATESDLALGVGDAYDDCIIAAVDSIMTYAKSQGQPAVVNLSLGSNSGPHDGSDDFSTYLDELGTRGIICVAAGNEGEDNMSITKQFTSSDNTVKTIIFYNNKLINCNYGQLDIWGDDSTPFTVKFYNINNKGNVVSGTSTTLNRSQNSEAEITKGVTTNSSYGGAYYWSGVDANSGRYSVSIFFDQTLPKSGRFAVEVSGTAGHKVNMYMDYGYCAMTNRYTTTSSPLSGYTAGTPDESISGMACGLRTISVGAYSTTAKYKALGSNSVLSTDQTVGDVASFSSYGHDFDGRSLPVVLAPGSMIMSSYSTPYFSSTTASDYGDTTDDMTASVTKGGQTYYWGPMEGTSMATPFAVGTIALWLQADPTMNFADVMDVIKNTSTADSYTQAQPGKSGYGKINAAEGLKYILAKPTALPGIAEDPAGKAIITVSNGRITVFYAGAQRLTAQLYDLEGRRLGEASSTATDEVSLDAEALHSGIYLLRVTTADGSFTRKILR